MLSSPQKQKGPVSPANAHAHHASSLTRLLIFLSPSQADAKGRPSSRTPQLFLQHGRPKTLQRVANCILNAMMRPRDSFITYLQPYLERLGHASSVVAMHIRSGWAEDHLSLPSSLASDVPERLLHAVEGFLRPTPADGAARSCKEGTEAHLESMRRCGDLCRCRPSISGSFASGLRELFLPDAAVQRFAGIDPLEVLANASTRWALLNSADDAAFSRLRWHSAVKLSEACGPHVPGFRRWSPPESASPSSPFSLMLQCAVRIAQRLAARHGAESGGRSPRRWTLAPSSDSPGLVHMLTQLPGLHAVGCVGPLCRDLGDAHSQRARAASDASIQTAVVSRATALPPGRV